MSNQPNTSDDGDRVVVPFMPTMRKQLGMRLSPPATKLVVTDTGSKSRFWRSVGAIWHRLVALSLVGAAAVTLLPHPAYASETPVPGGKDTRVRNVNYDPDQVVTIVGSFRHAIEIQFGPARRSRKPPWATRFPGRSRRSVTSSSSSPASVRPGRT